VERLRKITFWNVACLGNKDREFWKGLKEWDIVVLEETWMDEKGWRKIKCSLPKEFNWDIQLGSKKK